MLLFAGMLSILRPGWAQEVHHYPISECPTDEALCRALERDNDEFLLVIDKARRPPDYRSTQPVGTLTVIAVRRRLIVQRWGVGLGCHDGRKRAIGDKRTPEGFYHLIQRRSTKDGYPRRTETLGGIFFLTSYPQAADCERHGLRDELGICRRFAGELVGLHSGRRSGSCTFGCIRLTGPAGREDEWIELLDEEYVNGRRTPLVVGRVHPSFYAGSSLISACWSSRLQWLSTLPSQDLVVEMLGAPCVRVAVSDRIAVAGGALTKPVTVELSKGPTTVAHTLSMGSGQTFQLPGEGTYRYTVSTEVRDAGPGHGHGTDRPVRHTLTGSSTVEIRNEAVYRVVHEGGTLRLRSEDT